jgi:type II secretory pathway pseudopilin PulG
MKRSSRTGGFKLIEMMFTLAIVGVVGLVLYSLLNIGTVLGAKNTAVNTAHQQARIAMTRMLQDLYSAISLPYLIDSSGNLVSGAGPAAGISFQEWSSGPHKFKNNANKGDTQISITLTSQSSLDLVATSTPVVGQRLIVPTHQVEADIVAVSGPSNNLQITLAQPLPVDIKGTGSSVGDIVCFITDRCSYLVNNTNHTLVWNWKGSRTMGNDITNNTPFSTPTTQAGALYSRFVAAIDLSTSDLQYNNRGYKSANILLNGQVPLKARLTTYQ